MNRRTAAILKTSVLPVAVLVVANIAGCAPEAPPRNDASEGGILAAFKNFHDAFQQQDLNGVLATFTADAVVIDPPAPPGRFDGTEGIRSWADGAFQMFDHIEIAIQDPQVHTSGPAGWVTAYYVFEAAAEAMPEPYSAEGWVTVVFVHGEDGTYRSPLFQASPMPPGELAGGPQ
jgi:ketosteroid isomerase-like protein